MRIKVTERDSGRQAVFFFEHSPIRLGRGSLNDLVLDFPFVSECHAAVPFSAERLVYVDLGSRNGSSVDGKRTDHHRGVELTEDAVVNIGSLSIDLSLVSGRAERLARQEARDVPAIFAAAPLPGAASLPDRRSPASMVRTQTFLPSAPASDEAPSEPRLIDLSADDGQGVFLLTKGKITIGRTDANDICLRHGSVSRVHAQVVREGAGWLIEDLGGSNGVFVNGTRVSAGAIVAGDVIQIGQVQLRYAP